MGRILEIFVSSPGDLADERRAVAEVVGKLADAPHVSQRGYTVRAHLYEDVVPPVLADGPQAAIDTFMLDPARADVLVCLLGDRLGTRMRDPRSNEIFVSGTVYETTAARGSKKRPKPEVLMYCRRKPRPGAIGAHRREVEEFVADIVGGKGPLRGIAPAMFDASADLAQAVAKGLDAAVTRVIGLYEARRRRSLLLGLLGVVALGAVGYTTASYAVESAEARARSAEHDRGQEELSQEQARHRQFLSSMIARGPLETFDGIKSEPCWEAPEVADALVALQPSGNLPAIQAALGALRRLATAHPDDAHCGCAQVLAILRTRDPPVRYCQATHLAALQALQGVSCAGKGNVIKEYRETIRAPETVKNVFCEEEPASDLLDLEKAAAQVDEAIVEKRSDKE